MCRSHQLEEHEWGRTVALIIPSGSHQDWLWRYIERNPRAKWTDLVEEFVAAFQQQSRLDMLEAEWDSLQQGNSTVNAYYAKFVKLCTAVQAYIDSAFVVRKFLRNLNPSLHTQLIIHYGSRVRVETVDLGDIHRIAQQFEAAVAQQSKTVPAKTVQTDRQQLQCSFCQLRGHNVQTCYKKRNADSNRQTPTNSKANTPTTSHNNYSRFNNSSNNSSNHSTITRPNTGLLPLILLLLILTAATRVIAVGKQVIETGSVLIESRGTPGGNRLGL